MTHPSLTPRQREVLRARCQVAGRGEAAALLAKRGGKWSEWSVGKVLRSIACCGSDAQACWEHRAELEAASTSVR